MKKFLATSLLLILSCLYALTFAADCTFTDGDIRSDFKNCNPAIGVQTDENINLNVVNESSDFRTTVATVIRRVQVVTSIVAIGIIVYAGFIMVLPTSAEAKEQTKAKIFSVLLGFFVMIAATIIINAVINILYEIFK